MVVAYSFGVIDFFHYGHARALKEAKEHSDIHYFGLMEDEASRDWMGSIISDYVERRKVLACVRYIDEIIPQKTRDPLENLRWLHAKYPTAQIALYYGSNWKILSAQGYLESIGGLTIPVPYYDKFKPENILRLMENSSEAPRAHNKLLSTKANTLLALQQRISRSRIEDILIITGKEYLTDSEKVLCRIAQRFGHRLIVLRSSSSNEDCYASSNAGHYDSILHIWAEDCAAVKNSIETIFDSYRRDELDIGSEQILIQTETPDVAYSGVVFTRDINSNHPYYVVNYDDTGSTEYVTSGSGGKTIYISRDFPKGTLPTHWQKLLDSVQEIEELLSDSVLDIEFALTRDNQVVIFQTRPLAACYKFSKHSDDAGFFALKSDVQNRYTSIQNAVDGGPMLLSDMAFWNPAEIIGTNPHTLDYSLYRKIITSRAWNEGLVPMGYREVPQELMYRIANKPYISVEYSFMSLIPAVLPDELARKLAVYYCDKLKEDLSAHDKIEFEIAISCYDLLSEEKLTELLSHGFTENEVKQIRSALISLTHDALLHYPDVLRDDLADLNKLRDIQMQVEKRLLKTGENRSSLICAIRELLNGICQYGTPQFSRQARYAFLSRAICKSMVAKGYCSTEQMDAFMRTVQTVATDFSRDFVRFQTGDMATADFFEKYGHLRSGTYDISSPRYDSMQFSAMQKKSQKAGEEKEEPINEEPLELPMLRRVLAQLGLSDILPEIFLKIAGMSFEQREKFKFEFTKPLSFALELIAKLGEQLHISRQEMSYLDVADVLSAENYPDDDEAYAFFMTLIEYRKQKQKDNAALILPEVICGRQDFDVICMGEARPNFITNSVAEGETVVLESGTVQDIEGKIVVIEKADPGYDWIFASHIRGLITKYGGAASHMAIRCAEFGVPAAIGCGSMFERLCTYKRICIDCKNQKIERRI